MQFKTTIFDRFGNEWNVTADVEGRGMYDDNGDAAGFVVEGFELTNITLEFNGATLHPINSNRMPDFFNERTIRGLEREARDAFLDAWKDVQERAHSTGRSDEAYDTWVSQGLQK